MSIKRRQIAPSFFTPPSTPFFTHHNGNARQHFPQGSAAGDVITVRRAEVAFEKEVEVLSGNMTKLLQWLLGLAVLGSVWALVTFDLLELSLPRSYREVAGPMPLYLLVSFGCYSLATVGYRVATFNDCEEAAKELQEQIREAKEDLRRKGLKL